jgi:formate dehydrogenase subunit delta
MSPEKLIRMANQIAIFFETAAGGDPALAVADHLNKFWDPRMRLELLDIIAAGTGGINPLVVNAAAHVRPAEKITAQS